MASITQYPNAIGSYNSWNLGAGADKVVAVASDDGDTTYIWGSNGNRQWFVFPPLPADADTPVVSCVVSIRTRDDDVGGPFLYLYNGVDEVPYVAVGEGTTYQTWSRVHGYSSVTGINAAQLGVLVLAGSGIHTVLTEIKRVTVYNQIVQPDTDGLIVNLL